MTQESKDAPLCSFCGKSFKESKKLIAGPGVYICDSCIVICKKILDKELGVKTCGGEVTAKEIKQRIALLRKLRAGEEISENDYNARLKDLLNLMQSPGYNRRKSRSGATRRKR